MKKGISLIVLVITIIVMIILAASVVITLSNTGIIDRAGDAVDLTNKQQIENFITLAWSEAYANGTRNQEELETAVENALSENNISTGGLTLNVTTSGVTLVDGWVLSKTIVDGKTTKLEVKKDKQKIEVGKEVNYMTAGINGYTGGWKVLGVDDQNRILLLSSGAVTNTTLSGKSGFTDAITTLNNLCKNYKDGTMAIEARSIRSADVDALVNYDKNTFNKGKINQFGNALDFYWDASGSVKCKYGNPQVISTMSSHSKFDYYDFNTKQWTTYAKPSVETDLPDVEITRYHYYLRDYMDESLPAYSMVVGPVAKSYFMADQVIDVWDNFYVRYEVGSFAGVGYEHLNSIHTYYSNGFDYSQNQNVRAVVTLAKNAVLTESTTNPGTYDITLSE